MLSAALLLSACTDEQAQEIAKEKGLGQYKFDHPHGDEVSDLVKHKFEHQFADECVAKEVVNSPNKAEDKKRWEKPCLCIASFMMKDLTAVEAEKFVNEKKHTQSMRIRYENAAYHCLQKKAQVKGPQIFGKP